MRKILCFILLLVPIATFAATCPSGYISVSTASYITLAAECSSTQTDLGALPSECSDDSVDCVPDVACSLGVGQLKSGAGYAVSLYATKYTTPSLHIGTDDGECYVNLVGGTGSGINITYNGTTYHTTELHRCLNISASTTPTVSTPSNNTINWTATSASTGITGISHCASTSGSVGSTATSLTISTTLANNLYCWCRIIRPTVSAWSFGATYSATTTCDTSCAAKCASLFSSNGTFRNALINSM